MLALDPVTGRQQNRTLEDVLQLPDVARPAVTPKERERRLRDLRRSWPSHLARDPVGEELREGLDLADPLPERRDHDRDSVQTIEKVLSKAALRRLRIEV